MKLQKILHIPNYYPPHTGGIEQVVHDICESLDGQVEQRVLCFSGDRFRAVDVENGMKIRRTYCQWYIMSQSVSLEFNKALKEEIADFKPDTIIFHYPNPYQFHFIQRYRNKGIKLIVWYHLDIIKQKAIAWLFSIQNKRMLKWADKIVCTSPNYKEYSPNLKKVQEKCVVIPNCINNKRLELTEDVLAKAKEIKEKYAGKKIVFAFGRHIPYKGLTYLVQASKYLNDDYAVLIGGKGPLTNDLMLEAADDMKVNFLGKIPDDELKALLYACDIFAFPSITRNEAFGLALAEAMYYSKPAVTFTIPGSGVNYVNLKEVTGLEVPNADAKAFAQAIMKLGSDDELRHQYGLNANKRVLDNFTFDTFKENVLKLVCNK